MFISAIFLALNKEVLNMDESLHLIWPVVDLNAKFRVKFVRFHSNAD